MMESLLRLRGEWPAPLRSLSPSHPKDYKAAAALPDPAPAWNQISAAVTQNASGNRSYRCVRVIQYYVVP